MTKYNQIINQETFVIFGAGNTGRRVSEILNKFGKKVSYFLVSEKTKTNERESNVILLSESERITNKNIPVIIAVFNRERNSNISIIIKQLQEKGFPNIITYFEFHSIFAKNLGDNFWLTKPTFYVENQAKFKECLSLFEEQLSKILYKQIIEFLVSFNPDDLSEPNLDNQYFPEDIIVWDGLKAFIDIGTYDGQNIIDAYNKFGKLSNVIAFEPDLNNFKKLNFNLNWPNYTKEAILFPCGVWRETQMLHFSSGSGESSAISESGDIIIPVVSLDEVLKGVKPGYIKMDIEGAEIAALEGAKHLITCHKPSLAISIYHKPEHLFEIQLLINSWNLGYKFYIRFHGQNLFETVLYCI